ncbi:NAC domain-containing protein 35 [Linum perenne]
MCTSNDEKNHDQHDHRDEVEEEEEDSHEHDMVMPGFRFHPTEEELVEFYLRRKVEGKRFNIELITFLDLYRYDPWELPAMAAIGEKEWFFYVPRDRKYRNGDRPNRVTTSGYWKATGADRMIRTESLRSIGLKKTLVFYSGKAPKGVRSSWIMNEYRLPHHDTQRYQKTEISLCRVYKRAGVDDHHGGPSSLPRSLPTRPRQHHPAPSSTSSSSSKKQQLPRQPSVLQQHQLLLHPSFSITTCSSTAAATADSLGLISNIATSLGHPTPTHHYHPLLPPRQQEVEEQFLLQSCGPTTQPSCCSNNDDDNTSNQGLDDLHRLVSFQHQHQQQYYTRLLHQHHQHQHQHQNYDEHDQQLQHTMIFPQTTPTTQIWDWNPLPPQHPPHPPPQHHDDQLHGHGSSTDYDINNGINLFK